MKASNRLISQQLAVDLASIILWERVHELNPTRIFVERQFRFDELLDFFGEHFSSLATCDYERLGLNQSIAGVMTDDGAFRDRLVLQQAVFNFRRRDKNAANFQHGVSATVIPIVAVTIDMKLIAARAPIPGESFF